MMFGKNKSCPHCQKPIVVFTSYKVAIPLIALASFLAYLIRPLIRTLFLNFGDLGVSLAVGLTGGLLVGLAVMLAMRLKGA